MVRLFSFAQDKPQPFEVSVLIDTFGLRAVSTAPSEGSWEISIHSSDWLMPDGKHRNGSLRISRPVEKLEIERWFGRLPANTVMRLLVIGEKEALTEPEHYKLVSVVGIGNDPILNELASGLAKAVTYEDDVLGTLTLDRRLNQFWTEIGPDWERIQVSVNSMNDAPDVDELALLKTFWADWDRWNDQLKKFAAEQLLSLKQDEWFQAGEERPTVLDFISRMKPEDLSVNGEDEFVVFYDDGDLFFGHSIMVEGTLADGPTEASIQG